MKSILTRITPVVLLLLVTSIVSRASAEGNLPPRHEPAGTGSAIASLFASTDVNAWAAASYNYNFEGVRNSATSVANRTSSHTATNTFAVDQVWISLDNEATEDSRAGAHVDYEWGNVHGAGTNGALFSAYASYLAPIHRGVRVDLGLLPTLVGVEVNQTIANPNVTRGLVWDVQPVTHLGAIVHASPAENWRFALGVLNDPLADPPGVVDSDNEKAVTGQLGYQGESWSATGSFVWGEGSGDVDLGIYDLVFHQTREDGLTWWVNYTIRTQNRGAQEGEIHGIAIAARMPIADDLGVSVRGEALVFDLDRGATEQYSITATADHPLTEHLTAKAEVRIDIDGDHQLRDSNGARDEDVAAMFVAQLVYTF